MALAALFKLVGRGTIAPDETVVVVSTAHGLKFPDFKIDYHSDNLREVFGVVPRNVNRPVEVDADYEQVRSTVLRSIEAVPTLAG